TVHFTSSDGSATLPADSTLMAGTRSFSATLKTVGNQTITATDTANNSITGTSGIVVQSPFSFSFAVSAIDKQIYKYELNLSGGASSGWSLTAPGQFLSVATATYGPTLAPIAFGVGIDNKVYEAKFDANGKLLSGWSPVAPGLFNSLVVGNYGS